MIDSHCHLYFDKFDGQRENLIEAAADASVHTIINIGIDIDSSQACIDLACRHDNLFATVGVHPHDAKDAGNDTIDRLRAMASDKKVVAIGEIGLDFYRDISPRDLQCDLFHKQLELAIELSLPVVIHTRNAMDETLQIVRQYASKLSGGVFHCFPGDVAEAEEVISLGFLIGVGGVITYKNSGMAQMATEVDLGKLLLETDAPFLTPVPFRGKQNRPEYISIICERLSELKSITPAEVERVTDRNCQKLFGLVETFGE